MTQDYSPITPPPELIQQWWDGTHGAFYEFEAVVTQAARWGADAELEACVEWLGDAPVTWNGDEQIHPGSYLRAARRPKPPSLKEQALDALAAADGADYPVVATVLTADQHAIIRRALEALPE